jgi:hypothetical protein
VYTVLLTAANAAPAQLAAVTSASTKLTLASLSVELGSLKVNVKVIGVSVEAPPLVIALLLGSAAVITTIGAVEGLKLTTVMTLLGNIVQYIVIL